MVKDNAHPKAVNIIRPTHSMSVKRVPQPTQSSTLPGSKPKVAQSAKVSLDERPYGAKPQLNIFRPPPKRSQSQVPSTTSSQRQRPRPVATATTTTTSSRSNKPSFEIYKPSKKQPFSRSLTTSALPSTSTPASIPNQHQRQRPSAAPVQTSMTRSATNHSINAASLYVDSSDDDSDRSDACSETYSHKRHSLAGSDADTFTADTPIEPRSEKAVDEDEEEEEDDDDDGDSVINEARVNRKIADLEISNISLLAVNEMLEITVKRQASQVAKLKQQLEQDGAVDFKPVISPIQHTEQESDDEWENDDLFLRLRQMTEMMIESGKASLQYECRNVGGRVLSHYPMPEGNENYEGQDQKEEAPDQDATEQNKLPSNNQTDSLIEQNRQPMSRANSPRRRYYYSDSITWQPR